MQKIIHRADSRGFADHGWLKSHHSFSFADYYNPQRNQFGLLRVLNDDWIDAGQGFAMHPHKNMEIITIPLSGSLRHEDSLGYHQVITAGEVQRMSAGTGITHGEYNNSHNEAASLLQIWIFPKENNIEPSYAQKRFEITARHNKWQTIIAPNEQEGAMGINQEAFLSLAHLDESCVLNYTLRSAHHGAYVFVIEGSIKLASEILNKRDAMGLSGLNEFKIEAIKETEVLVIEVPMA